MRAIDLQSFDAIVINSSAGKDSQAMLDLLVEECREAGVLDRVLVVHCDLGRVEWSGTAELAEEQAAHYGLPFRKVSRPQGDLLEQVEKRGMWPSSSARYCTSDHKRGQVAKVLTEIAADYRKSGGQGACRILNCMGIRAQESSARAKKVPLELDKRATNGRREVWNWLPIFDWTVEQVWDRIKASGVRHHRAYDLGMPRLSCVFCIFSPKAGLLLAGRENPELLDQYVALEEKIGHDFRHGMRIAEIRDELDAGLEEFGEVADWTM